MDLTTSATQLTMEHNINLPNLNFQELLAHLILKKQALDDLIDGEELSSPIPEPIFVVSSHAQPQLAIKKTAEIVSSSVDGEQLSKMVKNVGLDRLKIENRFKIKKVKSKKPSPTLPTERNKERQPTADSSDLSEGVVNHKTSDDFFKCEYCTKVFRSS